MQTNPLHTRPLHVDSVRVDSVRVEPMTAEHARQVLAIYQAGIDEGDATFETSAPGWEEFSAARLPDHRYVAIGVSPGAARPGAGSAGGPAAGPGSPDSRSPDSQGAVLGWVAVSGVSSRCVYAGVVEQSVYVRPDVRGRGVGRQLMGALIASTEAAGIWTLQSGIFPENTASIRLHRAAGFRIVGTRERIGRRGGQWRDMLLMERRSPAI